MDPNAYFEPRIGLDACTRGLAEAGADVAIIYSTTKTAHEIAAKVAGETGVKVKAYQADVRDVDSITNAVNEVAKDFGGLDIIVVNSGITDHIDALEYSPDKFSNLMRVNLDGAFFTAQAAAKIFKQQGSGNVIFTSSVSSKLVNVPQKQAPYNASKAAVSQLAKCLAVEWVDFARVNIISPGFIATDSKCVHYLKSVFLTSRSDCRCARGLDEEVV